MTASRIPGRHPGIESLFGARRPPECGLDGTPSRPVECQDDLNAVGAALASARRELVHAMHLADQLCEMGVHMKAAGAVSLVDDATAEVQEVAS